MASLSTKLKLHPLMASIPAVENRRLRVVVTGGLLAALLCSGCTTHLPKSKACMDKPLQHYMQPTDR